MNNLKKYELYFLYTFIIAFINSVILYIVMWDTAVKDSVYSFTKIYTLVLFSFSIISFIFYLIASIANAGFKFNSDRSLKYQISLIFRNTQVPFMLSKEDRKRLIFNTKIKRYRIWRVLSKQINPIYFSIYTGAIVVIIESVVLLILVLKNRSAGFALIVTILTIVISVCVMVAKMYGTKIILNNEYFLFFCGVNHVSVTELEQDFKESLHVNRVVWVGEKFIYCCLDTYIAVFNLRDIRFIKIVEMQRIFPWQQKWYSLMLEVKGIRYYTQPTRNRKGLEIAFNKIF